MTATATRRVDVLCVYAHAARLIALLGQPDDSSWPVWCVHDNNTYASAVDRRDPPARHVLLFRARARAHPGSDDDGDRNRCRASYITKTTIIIIISYTDSLIFPRPTRDKGTPNKTSIVPTIIVDNRLTAKPLTTHTVDKITDSPNNKILWSSK